MAIKQIQSRDSLIRINDTDAISCVQDVSWDAQMNAEQLRQLGSANYDAQTITPEVSTSFSIRSSGSTASLLNRMIFNLDSETAEYVPPAGTSNDKLITELDLERAIFDLVEVKKANEIFDRSTLIPRVHLSSLSLSATADGTASESYSGEADLLEVYRKPKHDLRSVPVMRSAANPTFSVDMPSDAYRLEPEGTTVAGSTHVIYEVDIDGLRVPASALTVTTGVGAGDEDKIEIAIAERTKYVFEIGARIHAIIYKKTPGAFPLIADSNYGTTARFVKPDSINLYLVNPNTLFTVGAFANKKLVDAGAGILDSLVPGDLNAVPFSDADLILRAQSCEMQIPLSRTALREIRKNTRGNAVFYRAAEYPLQITCSLSAFETDLNEWARLQGKDLYGADASPDILDLADFETPQWMIVRRDYKGDTVLQTVVLQDARVSGLGTRMSVGGRSEVSWNFTGSRLFIKGSAV